MSRSAAFELLFELRAGLQAPSHRGQALEAGYQASNDLLNLCADHQSGLYELGR